MSKRRPTHTPTHRPLEKDELGALERAHRHAAEISTELHKLKAEASELQQKLSAAKSLAAATRAELDQTTATIRELTARLIA